jgi:hypothetical protein
VAVVADCNSFFLQGGAGESSDRLRLAPLIPFKLVSMQQKCLKCR